jgi:hypothetical protein
MIQQRIIKPLKSLYAKHVKEHSLNIIIKESRENYDANELLKWKEA